MPAKRNQELNEHPRTTHAWLISLVLASVGLFFVSTPANANELKEQTLAGWNRYVNSACLREGASSNESSFLRIDELPQARARVRGGEVLVWRQDHEYSRSVPHGLIHDWMGAVFVPKATISDVLAVARDYDRYSEIYQPAVVESKKLASTEGDDAFSMLLVQKELFVTAALKGEYQTRYVQVDAHRWYSISHSTSLQAIENFSQPDMRILPPDRGPGYVWRLYSLAKFEESDDGVYIELEALGLSRDVPMMVRWLVEPIVERLPKDSLRATLEETRKAVLAKIGRED
jgi:hypothetical protein